MSLDPPPALQHLFLRDRDLRLGIEPPFPAHRDFALGSIGPAAGQARARAPGA
jgi:hypothetical protein